MVYVVRVSDDIQADLKRGWSAWMNSRSENIEDLLELLPCDKGELEERWSRWQDPDHNPWHHRNHLDRQAFLLDYAEEKGWDIRFDSGCGMWAIVHHDGLSCFRLEAETEASAIAEAQEGIARGWFLDFSSGWQTEGEVRLIKSFGSFHLLECEEAWKEM